MMTVRILDGRSKPTRKWSIAHKLTAASTLMILLTLLAGGVGLWQVYTIGRTIDDVLETEQQLAWSLELLATGHRLVAALDHMVLAQDPLLASTEVPVSLGILSFYMEILQDSSGGIGTSALLEEMQITYDELLRAVNEVNVLARQELWTEANTALEQEVRPANKHMGLLIRRLVRQADRDMEVMASHAQLVVQQATLLLATLVLLTMAIALGWRRFVFQGVSLSITKLRRGVARISSGDLEHKLDIRTGDEIEELGDEFNKMADEMADLIGSLEQRVAERTADLGQRSVQLKAAAHVAREAAAIRDVELLLGETVRLISDRFGFYHAGIFLLDDPGEYAVLRAASSEGGQRMLDRRHKLKIGEVGIVGWVAGSGQSRITLDVGTDAVFFDNPDLPHTRSEMALPLKVHERTIGVLDVQSTEEAAFTDEDVAILQTMADQVALAIENARLLEESQRALRELEALYGQQVREAWQERVTRQPAAYRYTRVGVERAPLPVSLETEAPLPHHPQEENNRGLVSPIRLRGQTLGSIVLRRDPDEEPWSTEEVALVEEVSTQIALALENARLLEETQRRAERDRLIADITARVRSSMDIESILRTAVRELGVALGTDRASVRLGVGTRPPEE
jgi:GAF domain-containing protein/HAMP domain-containing protein